MYDYKLYSTSSECFKGEEGAMCLCTISKPLLYVKAKITCITVPGSSSPTSERHILSHHFACSTAQSMSDLDPFNSDMTC